MSVLTLNRYLPIPVKKLSSKLSLNYVAIIENYYRHLFNVPENALTFLMYVIINIHNVFLTNREFTWQKLGEMFF